KGYDERMGARPLGRVIQEHIKKELANELLFGKLKHGGTVKVTVGDKNGAKGLILEAIPAEVPVKPKKEKAPGRKSAPAKGKTAKTARKPAEGKDPKPPKAQPDAIKPAEASVEVAERPAPKKPSSAVPKVPRKK
ncbi:MAG: ATP-dependent Clp protease ATP-binding subunit ClpA, partial [Hoeflea sp.]|nr:ATP-dependent Clp protease ATP-binding subunit ClpA [Hoeflea sp.]